MFKMRRVSFVAALVLVIQLIPVNARAAGGSISGSVESTGSAIPNICVRVYDAYTGIRTQSTLTDANGMYTVDGLAPGDYLVQFRDCVSPSDYASEWNDNVRTKGLATPVTVSVGATTQVNASLDPWGAISGSVESSGSALQNICVRVFDPYGRGAGWARTDANGMYTLKIRTLLGTDSYLVRFYDCVAPYDYAWEWFDGAPAKRLATRVTVTVGETTQVNASLDPWGAIAGSVENSGSAISGICVRVFDRFGRGAGWARTDANGMYMVKIRTLHGTGNFSVRFEDCVLPDDYASEWYDNVRTNRKSATPVEVTVGQITRLNDTLETWGSFSGTVTDEATRRTLPNMCVTVYQPGGGAAGWARTDANGRYTVKVRTPLGRGNARPRFYKVRFSDCFEPGTYIPEWFDNAATKRLATPLTANAGETTRGIDAALAKWGSVFGKVTDEVTTAALPDVCVGIFDAVTERKVASVKTITDGTYKVGGLPGGSYKVEFRDCVAPVEYNLEWYQDNQNWHDADVVNVRTGEATRGINGALTPNRSFTLSLGKAGTGNGGVTSQPAGINCGSNCTHDYLKGTVVTLTAAAAVGSSFTGWSGACSGTSLQTSITMDASKTCTATFSVTGGRHLRSLTFGLWGHLFAGGNLTAADRFPACYQNVAVQIQRQGLLRWNTIGTVSTGATGWYRIRIMDLVGRYRALVPEVTLPSGDVCAGAISPVRWNRNG